MGDVGTGRIHSACAQNAVLERAAGCFSLRARHSSCSAQKAKQNRTPGVTLFVHECVTINIGKPKKMPSKARLLKLLDDKATTVSAVCAGLTQSFSALGGCHTPLVVDPLSEEVRGRLPMPSLAIFGTSQTARGLPRGKSLPPAERLACLLALSGGRRAMER